MPGNCANHRWCRPTLGTSAPGSWRRVCAATADSRACTTNSVLARSRIVQPTTCLESRSITAARYIQPSCVRIKVKTLSQAVSGSVTSNCRSSRLAAAGHSVPPWKRGLRPSPTCARCTTPGLPNLRSYAYGLCVVIPSRSASSATLNHDRSLVGPLRS